METGLLWLTSGPASILAEPIPAGILTANAVLQPPPPPMSAAEILPENLQDAWVDGTASAFAIATALSQKSGKALPWKTVRDVIGASLQARFTELDATSGTWPCDYVSAIGVKLKVAKAAGGGGHGGGGGGSGRGPKVPVADAELSVSEMQDLGDVVGDLANIKGKTGCPIRFHVRIEIGDDETPADAATVTEVNQILENLKPGFRAST